MLALPWAARTPLANAAPGGKLTKYLEPVPLPGAGVVVATPSGTNRCSFTQTEIARQLRPELPPTPLWAYDDGSGLGGQSGSFGIAVVAHSGTPLDIDFTHDLPETYTNWIPVDTRLTPLGKEVRLMTHLHGGFVAGASDGNPAVTPNGFGSGDVMLVNGKVWPFLNVEPRMYRFRILNGCNARILDLDIGGPSFWRIGAEGGMGKIGGTLARCFVDAGHEVAVSNSPRTTDRGCRRQGRDRYEQLLPATGRSLRGARPRPNDLERALASTPPGHSPGEGVQCDPLEPSARR